MDLMKTSVATRKNWEAFEVVDFGESLGASILSLCSEHWLSDKAADVGLLSLPTEIAPLKIVLQRGLLSILKSLRSWLVW